MGNIGMERESNGGGGGGRVGELQQVAEKDWEEVGEHRVATSYALS
jgi:hypothetical protein